MDAKAGNPTIGRRGRTSRNGARHDRALVILHALSELTLEELAAMFGMTVRNVNLKVAAHRDLALADVCRDGALTSIHPAPHRASDEGRNPQPREAEVANV